MPLVLVCALLFLAVSLIGASTRSVAAQETNEGREEYLLSCAVCHGQDGRGLGSMTSKLQIKPADLTSLAKRDGGVYLPNSVYEKIDGRRGRNFHAKSAMPIWGCRHIVPSSGIRAKDLHSIKTPESALSVMWRRLDRTRHNKTKKAGRQNNRFKGTQADAFLDMPCDSEAVIHHRIQSLVDYLQTIQIK
jgi:hypothetical protein